MIRLRPVRMTFLFQTQRMFWTLQKPGTRQKIHFPNRSSNHGRHDTSSIKSGGHHARLGMVRSYRVSFVMRCRSLPYIRAPRSRFLPWRTPPGAPSCCTPHRLHVCLHMLWLYVTSHKANNLIFLRSCPALQCHQNIPNSLGVIHGSILKQISVQVARLRRR